MASSSICCIYIKRLQNITIDVKRRILYFSRIVSWCQQSQLKEELTQAQTAEKFNQFQRNKEGIAEKILKDTRKRIKRELKGYNLSFFGSEELNDLIPEHNGKPYQVLLVSTFRAGTTFLSYLLGSLPGNIHYHNPFWSFKLLNFSHPNYSNQAYYFLQGLLECDLFNESFMPKVVFKAGSVIKGEIIRPFYMDSRMHLHCKEGVDLCFDPEFRQQFCKLFPIQIIKEVHVRLFILRKIIKDQNLKLKVIYMVRDPRAISFSRQEDSLCEPLPECARVEQTCAQLFSDYLIASTLMQRFPHRLRVVRFEDLALNPYKTAMSLLKFLNFNMKHATDEFLNTLYKLDNGTSAWVTKEDAFNWKKEIDVNENYYIQSVCKNPMTLWGYVPAENQSHLRSPNFHPITDYNTDIKKFQDKIVLKNYGLEHYFLSRDNLNFSIS